MTSVTVSRDFRITIPRQVREAVGIRVGQQIQVMVHEGCILLIPVRPVQDLRGFLAGIDIRVERWESTDEILLRARAVRAKTAGAPITDEGLTVAKADDRP